MEGSTILVTGAAGFIGSHAAEALLARGNRVVGVDNFDEFYSRTIKDANLKAVAARAREKGGRFEFEPLDVTDAPSLAQLVGRVMPDAILHLAALAGVRPSIERPAQYARVNVEGTTHLLDAAVKNGVRRVVFASAARIGMVAPLGGQEVIPSVRFFAGGSRSVRGVDEEGLGRRDFLGGPAGGQSLLLLNQEVRFPVFRWVRGVGFIDAGNVFERVGDLSLRNLTASVGIGIRLTTPFAILRADYGRRVHQGDPEALGGSRWTFGIGHAF